MSNPWLSLTFQAARLAWDAQNVVALRLMRLAGGGAEAQTEASAMVAEKAAAFSQAQTVAVMAMFDGGGNARTARKILAIYKGKVRANRRRLSN